MTVSWLVLFLSGLLESVIPILIIKSQGYSHVYYTAILVLVVTLSVLGLRYAIKSIPLAIAYIVWTAMGILGTVIVGTVLLNEPISWLKTVAIITMVVAIAGLRISSIPEISNITVSPKTT